MAAIVSQLPEVNRAVLCFVLEFLHEIVVKTRESEQDEMACCRLLSATFGHACMKPEKSTAQQPNDLSDLVMQQLILQYKELFSGGSEGCLFFLFFSPLFNCFLVQYSENNSKSESPKFRSV